MAWFPFKFRKTPNNFLGIDIGTYSLRVVELARQGQSIQLQNYGEVRTSDLPPAKIETAKALSAVLKEAGIKTKEANFSIPDFSSFFTTFELPPMSPKELEQAVRYEARSYVPLPLSEITLDWSLIEGGQADKSKETLKVLVDAIPNEVISEYKQIAFLVHVELKVLEAEVFALSRSLAKNEQEVCALLDIGARSTTCSIVHGGKLKVSHSFNVSGNELTQVLSQALKIDYQQAEELKKEKGLTDFSWSGVNPREILLPLVDAISSECKRTFRTFQEQEGREIKKVVMAGGTSLMPGLVEYFAQDMKPSEVVTADPFVGLSSPPILHETLKEMGPSYAVAVGLALRGMEQ